MWTWVLGSRYFFARPKSMMDTWQPSARLISTQKQRSSFTGVSRLQPSLRCVEIFEKCIYALDFTHDHCHALVHASALTVGRTWLARLPRPIRKLSGLMSLWMKLFECTNSILDICSNFTNRILNQAPSVMPQIAAVQPPPPPPPRRPGALPVSPHLRKQERSTSPRSVLSCCREICTHQLIS